MPTPRPIVKVIPLVIALCFLTGAATSPDDRQPVPNSTDCAAARQLVDAAFKYEPVANDPSKQLELAHKLVEAANSGRDSVAVRYVELCRARDLAAAVDFATAVQISDQLCKSFAVDPAQSKLDLLSKAGARPSVPAVESVISWSDQAIHSGRLDRARRLANAALNFAEKMNDPLVLADAHDCLKRLTQAEKDARIADGLKARLKADPENLELRMELGRFLCADQNRWSEGLALLQTTPDVTLRRAVAVEVSNPQTPASMLTAADDWWEIAESDHAFPANAARSRAVMWYSQALEHLSGIDKVRVELRLADATRSEEFSVPGVSGKWITLAWSGVKWEPSKQPVTTERLPGSIRLSNLTAAKVYFVNDRIIAGNFALAMTEQGKCLVGLLSADRADHSLFCTAGENDQWHEIRFDRLGQSVTAAIDSVRTEVKYYNGAPAMSGVLGLLLEPGQSIEIRTLVVR